MSASHSRFRKDVIRHRKKVRLHPEDPYQKSFIKIEIPNCIFLLFRIMEALEAKGGGKGKRLNGKFLSLKNRSKVDDILYDYFERQ